MLVSLLLIAIACITCDARRTVGSGRSRRIWGGREVNRTSVPWQVFVQERRPAPDGRGTINGVCGGSILSSRIILTAAHCVEQKGTVDHVHIMHATRHVGITEEAQFTTTASRKIINSGYHYVDENGNKRTNNNKDLAILLLDNPIPLEKGYTEAVELATSDPEIGERCLQSGYGETQNRNNDPQLKMAYARYQGCTGSQQKDGAMCFFGKINDDFLEGSICQGDSGGPLICGGKLAGVVSATAQGRNGGGNCRDTSIFVSVSSNRDWIAEKLAELGHPMSSLTGQRVNMFPHGENGRGGDLPEQPRPVLTPVERPDTQPVAQPRPVVSNPVARPREPVRPVVSQPVSRPVSRPVFSPPRQNTVPRGDERGPNGKTPAEQFKSVFGNADPCGEPSGDGWAVRMSPLPSVSSMQIIIRQSDREYKVALGYAACLKLSYSQYRAAKQAIEDSYFAYARTQQGRGANRERRR